MQQDSGYGPLPRRRGSGSWLTHTIVGVLAAGLAVAVVLLFFTPASGSSLPGSGAVPAPAPSAAPLARSQQDIVNKVKPGLVLINTTLQYDSEAAAGTGMVINADGLVLTNNHVIEDSTKITATVTSTGKTYPARVVGYDQTGDVALIQLQNASGLTTVPIGNSSSVKAGEAVVAMGNAEGQGTITATAGHVTALNQTITASDEAGSTTSETLYGMIQTNADIVPGDSGGPLASSAGVIGMDTAGNDLERPAGTCRRVRDPDQHGAVGRPADRRRPRQLGHHHRLPALPGHLHRLRIQQQPADAGTTAGAAERRLRRFREHPGCYTQQCRPDHTVGHRAGQLGRPDRRDDLRKPRGLGRHDRRSGHHGGERAGGRLTRRLCQDHDTIPSRRHHLRDLGEPVWATHHQQPAPDRRPAAVTSPGRRNR